MTTETPDIDADDQERFTDRMASWLKGLATRRSGDDLHEALAGLIEDQTTAVGPQADEPEYQLLQNIVALRERTVADCMCPRADIVAVEAGMDFIALVDFVVKEAHSRYPVYRESMDDVIGIVILKDVMASMAAKEKDAPGPAIDTLLRDVLFVPTSMPVMKLLLQMRQKRHHLAMVVDEYGGITGLVTIEDLVEQIVGEIEDEHDENNFASPIVKADGSLVVDGRMPLKALEEHLGSFLSTDERDSVNTVNGLVLSLAGRVPARGTSFDHGDTLSFEVTEVDTRRVKKLRIRRK